jgi:hypothetical protein
VLAHFLERDDLIRLVAFSQVVLSRHAQLKLQHPKLLLHQLRRLFGRQECNHGGFWSAEDPEAKGGGFELSREDMPLLYRDHVRVCDQVQTRCVDYVPSCPPVAARSKRFRAP